MLSPIEDEKNHTPDVLEPTIAEQPSIAIRSKKVLPKQSSLGAMLKDIHQDVVADHQESILEFNDESVQLIWKEFLEINKGKLQHAFLSVAEKQLPVLDGEVITFTETNNISLELLQLYKMDILSFFRTRINSKNASLSFKLLKNDQDQKAYKTPKDRLKDMIVDNASVLKFIEKLDLNEY